MNKEKIKKSILPICILLIVVAVADLVMGGPAKLITGAIYLFDFMLPYLLKLIVSTLGYIILPIVIYSTIAWYTPKRWWRLFSALVVNATLYIFLRLYWKLDFSFSTIPTSFYVMTQIYVLLLFSFPREVWNWLGSVLLFVKGLAVTLMPDLPGNLDDFAMVFAIFIYIYLYLHTLIFFVKNCIHKVMERYGRQPEKVNGRVKLTYSDE